MGSVSTGGARPTSAAGDRLFRRLGILALAVALLVAGAAATRHKLALVRGGSEIGHADEAAYVHMARSLSHGRGLDVDYISFFFIPYDRGITRREDHWPPFLPLTIAPFLGVLGDTPASARVAPILIGSFALPLMTAWLGLLYSRRAAVGLLAGLAMLANSSLFTDSMRTMSDISVAALLAGFCASALSAVERPRRHLLSGLLAAAAFYAKGSLIVLIGLQPVLAVLLSGRRALRCRWLYLGMTAAALALSPWLISNAVLFGNPLHSTQNYVSSFFGVDAFDPGLYKPYWGHDLPRLADRWKGDPAKARARFLTNREQMARWTILGPSTNELAWSDLGPPGAWIHDRLLDRRGADRELPRPRPPTRWQEPVTALMGILAVLGVLVLLVRALTSWIRSLLGSRWWPATAGADPTGQRPPAGGEEIGGAELTGPTLALLAVAAFHWIFIVVFWKAIPRFSYPLLPIVAVMGCTTFGRLIEVPLRLVPSLRSRIRDGVAAAALAVAALMLLACDGGGLRSAVVLKPLTPGPVIEKQRWVPSYPELGRWIGENLPGAIVMTRNPWELLYYCGPRNKAVGMPAAPPDDIFSIARYYRVTHYLADTQRPGMEPFLSGDHPGLVPVPGAPGRLFKLDYEHLPDSGLTGATDPGLTLGIIGS